MSLWSDFFFFNYFEESIDVSHYLKHAVSHRKENSVVIDIVMKKMLFKFFKVCLFLFIYCDNVHSGTPKHSYRCWKRKGLF